jgi:hypothetical protein
MSTRLALCLMKELAFKALLLPGVKKAPSLRMMDLLLFSLVSFKLKMHFPMSNVEMVISVEGTQVDQEFAVSKLKPIIFSKVKNPSLVAVVI